MNSKRQQINARNYASNREIINSRRRKKYAENRRNESRASHDYPIIPPKSKSKAKRNREKPPHRWTNDQTKMLIEAVLNEIKENPEKFEKPTAQKFYINLYEVCPELSTLGWILMKNKMRNLKQSYLTAINWNGRTDAGFLAEGDEKIVREYVFKVCPYWDLLEQIYGQSKIVHPTEIFARSIKDEGDREFLDDVSPIQDFNSEEISAQEPIDNNNKETSDSKEHSESLDSFSNFKNMFKHRSDRKYKTSVNRGSLSYLASIQERKLKIDEMKLDCQIKLSYLVSIQEQKLKIDQMKLDRQTKLEEEKLGIEKEKLNLMKEKIRNDSELKKFELEKQIDLKNLEMERDERLAIKRMQLEMEKEERLQRYELELKFKNN